MPSQCGVHPLFVCGGGLRREWVAGQGYDVRTSTWDLSVDDLVPVEGTPRTLPAGLALPSELAETLALEYGLVVALCSPKADAAGGASSVAVYRRPPVDLPDVRSCVGALCYGSDDVVFPVANGANSINPYPATCAGSPSRRSGTGAATGACAPR